MMKMTTADSHNPSCRKRVPRQLLFRVDPVTFESPIGYLCRVAHAHGYDGPRWLADLAGIPSGGFELEDRCKQLAYTLRLQATEWRRMCYMPAKGQRERRAFLGQIIGTHQLNYTRPRVCPCCLRNRSMWWAVWDLKLVSACPIHRCLLVDLCPSCGRKLTWHRRAVHECRCGQDLREVKPEGADNRLVMINAAIWSAAGFHQDACDPEAKRVNCLPAGMSLQLDAMLRLIRFLGSVHEDGRIRRKQIRPFADLDIAAKMGIGAATMLMDWPRPFKDTLRRMANEPNHGPPALNFHKVFGNFYRHLFNVLPRKEFGFLHDAFETFVAEDWNGLVRGQHRWFSSALRTSTKWITASEGQKVYGASKKLIKNLVRRHQIKGIFVNTGLHRTECWIWRESLRDWVAKREGERASYMSGPELKGLLGLKHETLMKIVQAGLIRYSKGVDKSFPNSFSFRREDVTRIANAFDKSKSQTCTDVTPGSVIALGQALKNYLGRDIGLPSVIGAVIEGKLSQVGYTSAFRGIMGYLFRSDDLRQYRPSHMDATHGGFVSFREAATLLTTRTEVIRALVKQGLPTSPNEYRNGFAKLIPSSNIERFAAHYIDASILAKLHGITKHRFRCQLRNMKLPALEVPIPGKGHKLFVSRESLVPQCLHGI